MPKSQILSTPKNPGYLLPDGWSDGWLAAKAAAGATPATILFIGDSIMVGGGSTDIINKNLMSRIKASLSASIPTYADFWGYASSSKTAYAGAGTPANAPFQDPLNAYTSAYPGSAHDGGWTRTLQFTGTGANAASTFTTPYACTDLDIVYLDLTAGTWQYRVDGGTLVTVRQAGNGFTQGCVNQIQLTGLASTTHTIDFGWQSANSVMLIQGVATYPSGRAATAGLGYGRLAYGYGEMRQYSNPASASLFDRILLMAGIIPQGPWFIGNRPTAPTLAAAAGGSVDVGQHYYNVSLVGSSGESVMALAAANITIAGGTQTVNGSAVSVGATAFTTRRRIYRTKAGTSTPFYFLQEIADDTTTTFVDTAADSTLTAVYPLAFAVPAQAATGFGFPTQPNLTIIALGINDCNNARSETDFRNGLQRFIQATRRGNPNSSILLVSCYYPFNNQSGLSAYSGFAYSDDNNSGFANGDGWNAFKTAMARVARAYSCGFVDLEQRWGATPVAKGFLPNNDIHPTDAGHQDMANAILAVI
jgi:lysophospholipase L1-like esterase